MHPVNKLSLRFVAILAISLLSFGLSSADELMYVQAGALIDVQDRKSVV